MRMGAMTYCCAACMHPCMALFHRGAWARGFPRGREAQRNLFHDRRGILPNLVDKFSDAKSMVRAANHKIIKRLMLLTSPMQVLDLMGSGMQHPSMMVREEVVNACIAVGGGVSFGPSVVPLLLLDLCCGRRGRCRIFQFLAQRYAVPLQTMLQSNGQQLDFPKILRVLCTAMIDNKERVKAVGLEALAVMNNCVGQTQFLQVRAGTGSSMLPAKAEGLSREGRHKWMLRAL